MYMTGGGSVPAVLARVAAVSWGVVKSSVVSEEAGRTGLRPPAPHARLAGMLAGAARGSSIGVMGLLRPILAGTLID
jgi:hypothetical protein